MHCCVGTRHTPAPSRCLLALECEPGSHACPFRPEASLNGEVDSKEFTTCVPAHRLRSVALRACAGGGPCLSAVLVQAGSPRAVALHFKSGTVSERILKHSGGEGFFRAATPLWMRFHANVDALFCLWPRWILHDRINESSRIMDGLPTLA